MVFCLLKWSFFPYTIKISDILLKILVLFIGKASGSRAKIKKESKEKTITGDAKLL